MLEFTPPEAVQIEKEEDDLGLPSGIRFMRSEFGKGKAEGEECKTYIVKTLMPSAERIKSSKYSDDRMHKEMDLLYPKEIQDKIHKIRNWFTSQKSWFITQFQELSLTNKTGVDEILELAKEANEAFAKIDPALNIKVYKMPLEKSTFNDEQIKSDLMYTIMLQYVSEIIDHLQDRKKLTTRGVAKLRQIRRKYDGLNIINDAEASAFIGSVVDSVVADNVSGSLKTIYSIVESSVGSKATDDDMQDIMKDLKDKCKAEATTTLI